MSPCDTATVTTATDHSTDTKRSKKHRKKSEGGEDMNKAKKDNPALILTPS